MYKSVQSTQNRAILYMIISALCFAIMSVSVVLVGNEVPIFEKVFFRNFFSIFFAYYILKKNNAKVFGTRAGLPYLIGRSIFGVGGVICMFYALARMDVATASTIQKLSQFWVLIFAALFLKEKIKGIQVIFLVIALVGVVIVSKPTSPSILLPTLVCFLASVFAGIAYTFVSILRKYEAPETVVFFFSLFATVSMLIPMLMDFKWLTASEFIFLVITGLSAMGGQVFLTQSYHHAKASEVSIYAYANIVFSAVLSLLIWRTFPDAIEMVGIFIILVASYMNYVYVKKQSIPLMEEGV